MYATRHPAGPTARARPAGNRAQTDPAHPGVAARSEVLTAAQRRIGHRHPQPSRLLGEHVHTLEGDLGRVVGQHRHARLEPIGRQLAGHRDVRDEVVVRGALERARVELVTEPHEVGEGRGLPVTAR